MVRKVLLCIMVLLLWTAGALADWKLTTVHRSIVNFANGEPDYSTARFLGVWSGATNYDAQMTKEDVNLKGNITFSGGNYSFWNGKKGMSKISGTPYTFGLIPVQDVGGPLEYVPITASADSVVFCLEANGGLNGVNVSWNFPDKPSYNGQGTVPNYRTTQEQLNTFVPYVEYISSGSQVTGLRWRLVSPDNTAEAVTLDFTVGFRLFNVLDIGGYSLYSGSWITVEAGNPVSGDVTFDEPINGADITLIRAGWNVWNGNSESIYQWYFYNPSEPAPWMLQSMVVEASLVNGKSDYGNASFGSFFFDIQAEGIVVEAKHFAAEGTMTIPGGGYSLGDDNGGKALGVTVPNGTDRTFRLRMHKSVFPSATWLEYQPIDDNGTNLQFKGDAETNLPGKTITWTFPAEMGLSGSATVERFKTVAEQIASGAPYVELVSADGKLTAVNFRMVKSSDISTALTLPYRTNFQLRFDRINPEVDGQYYYSDWMYNTSSGTWTLREPQDLSNMECITVRYWSWENPDRGIMYHWEFYPARPDPANVSIITSTLPSGTTGVPYSVSLQTEPYAESLSVSSGILPPGLTLQPWRAISGTPTTAGTYSFTLKATRGTATTTRDFTITIASGTLAITTSTLPSGTVGETYSARLTSDSTRLVSWSLSSGTLPDGLTLYSSDGGILGIPTKSGTFTFTIQARDSYASATKSFTITIAAKPVSPDVTPQRSGGGGGGCSTGLPLLSLALIAALFITKRR